MMEISLCCSLNYPREASSHDLGCSFLTCCFQVYPHQFRREEPVDHILLMDFVNRVNHDSEHCENHLPFKTLYRGPRSFRDLRIMRCDNIASKCLWVRVFNKYLCSGVGEETFPNMEKKMCRKNDSNEQGSQRLATFQREVNLPWVWVSQGT
jgi:hypothetical protein